MSFNSRVVEEHVKNVHLEIDEKTIAIVSAEKFETIQSRVRKFINHEIVHHPGDPLELIVMDPESRFAKRLEIYREKEKDNQYSMMVSGWPVAKMNEGELMKLFSLEE